MFRERVEASGDWATMRMINQKPVLQDSRQLHLMAMPRFLTGGEEGGWMGH